MLKHQVAGKVTMEGVVKIGEKLKVPDAWYRIVKIQDKQWVEFEQDKMQPRDSILNTFSRKFRNQTPWGDEELLDMSEEGKVGKAVQATLIKWDLEGTNFYLQLEGKLRLHKDSHISRELKQTYQAAMKMAQTAPHMMAGFTTHTTDGITRGAIPLHKITVFWIATVSTFGALSEDFGPFVYSKDEGVKATPRNAQRCVLAFGEAFPGITQFSQQSLFEEGKEGAHDLCGAISRTMEGGSQSKNWVKLWTPLLAKKDFNDQETQRLTLGIRLAKTPPEVHVG